MKKLLILGLLLVPAACFAQQHVLVQTSLSENQGYFSNIAQFISLAGITTGPNSYDQTIFFVGGEQEGALTLVGRVITVARGQESTVVQDHFTGDMVLSGRPSWFYIFNPSGHCDAETILVTPWVNVQTNQQFLCSGSPNGIWVCGWNNFSCFPGATQSVASVNGFITPTGPLFHVTGTAQITGFNIPLGFSNQTPGFCIIPDGAFTTTTTNNIAVASTAIVGKQLCYTYTYSNAKPFSPSY